jgi:hypothetical protein
VEKLLNNPNKIPLIAFGVLGLLALILVACLFKYIQVPDWFLAMLAVLAVAVFCSTILHLMTAFDDED